MIKRTRHEKALIQALDSNPVAALLGPRQSGKTTLAKQVAGRRKSDFFDLEDPADRARLTAPAIVATGDEVGIGSVRLRIELGD